MIFGGNGSGIWRASGNIDESSTLICFDDNFQLECLCWYVPEYSVLVRPFIVWSPLTFKDFVFVSYIVFVVFILSIPIAKAMLSKLLSSIRIYSSEIKKLRW